MTASDESEARTLIARLRGDGVRFRVMDGRVRVEPPARGISAKDKAALQQHRDTVRALLNEDETDEFDEASDQATRVTSSTSLNSSRTIAAAGSQRATLLARVRGRLSHKLRGLTDDDLQALSDWHILHAFARDGAGGFRRRLPPLLRDLSDDEIVELVDWDGVATIEQTLFARSADSAAAISKGATALAAWWNDRRARQSTGRAVQGKERGDAVQATLTGTVPVPGAPVQPT